MRFLSLAILLAVLASPLAAQTVVEGQLTEPDGTPRVDVRLVVESGRIGPGVLDSTVTDADGRFRLALPEPATYGLGIGAGFGYWVPMVITDPADTVRLDLQLASDVGDREVPSTFSATSSVPMVADLMRLYSQAEVWHRTELTSPELEAASARAEAALAAAPLDRKNAVRDSLQALIGPMYDAILQPRVQAFEAGASPDDAPLVQSARALWALHNIVADSVRAVAVFERVSPSSPLWSYHGLSGSGVNNLLFKMSRVLAPPGEAIPPEFEAYLRTLAYDYPDPNVRAPASGVLLAMLDARGDGRGAEIARERLLREHPDSRAARRTQRDDGPDRRVRPGQPIPDFALPSLADSTVSITAASLAGTTYLVDFWGTWCAPCVAELPSLHDLYQTYREQGFEILSVATFDTEQDIADFRAEGFPMPWQHTLLPDGDMESARETFEFTGIPAYVLVGPDGTILAEGPDARGDALAAALAAHFGDE